MQRAWGRLGRAVIGALLASDRFLGSLNWTAVVAVAGLALLVAGIWLEAGMPRAFEVAGGLLLASAVVDALLAALGERARRGRP